MAGLSTQNRLVCRLKLTRVGRTINKKEIGSLYAKLPSADFDFHERVSSLDDGWNLCILDSDDTTQNLMMLNDH